jgi:hypothetical protein
MKESFILENTGMSRSSLYKAKHELIDSGKITMFSHQDRPLHLSHSRRTAMSQRVREPETPNNKEKKKTITKNQQHAAQSAAPTFCAPNDDEFFLSFFSNAQSQQTIEARFRA